MLNYSLADIQCEREKLLRLAHRCGLDPKTLRVELDLSQPVARFYADERAIEYAEGVMSLDHFRHEALAPHLIDIEITLMHTLSEEDRAAVLARTVDVATIGQEEIKVTVGDWQDIPLLRPDLGGGQSIFVAGDIGGEYRHLMAIENACAELADLDSDPFYWLGDLNDRGPASIKCVRHVLDRRSPFKNLVEIQSNHGIMLWTAIEGGKAAVWMNDIWRRNGGKTTLQELGIDTATMEFIHLSEADRVSWLSEKLREHFSAEDLQTLRGNPSHVRHGNLLFVHAGINPNMTLEETFGHDAQLWWGPYGMGTQPEDWHWAWIRFLFLGHEGEWPGGVDVVVHGHTDFGPRGFVNGNRIALDSNKAQPTMRMAAEIQNGRMRLITAQGESEKAPL